MLRLETVIASAEEHFSEGKEILEITILNDCTEAEGKSQVILPSEEKLVATFSFIGSGMITGTEILFESSTPAGILEAKPSILAFKKHPDVIINITAVKNIFKMHL